MQTAPRSVAPYKLNHSAFGNRHSAFSSAPALSKSKGFTLTELLVVIGIIIILVGILLPVVSKIRYAAYSADTQNEISQISNACTSYYSTFHAYPGPFSNDDTTGGPNSTIATGFGTGSGPLGNPNPTLTDLYFNAAGGPLSNDTAFTKSPWTVTGAENLVLGLMGGLREVQVTAAPPTYALAFAPTEVGLGPLSLNTNNPARTPSFFSTGSNYLMWCQLNGANQNVQTTGAYQAAVTSSGLPVFTGTAFTDPAGTAAFDCPIPVFVDRFPAPGPLPILYLRARTGAKGVVWDNINVQSDGNGNQPADYQYDLRDIYPYTYSHIGLVAGTPTNQTVMHNLVGVGPSFSGPVTNTTALNSTAAVANGGLYFTNQSIPPTGSDPNWTGRPRAVDQFILISAGKDGIYGTPDDITSFGSVSN